MPHVKKLGDEGWELVTITARASRATIAGNTVSNNVPTAGITTDELWVFKRAK